jgi:hypothetical protein
MPCQVGRTRLANRSTASATRRHRPRWPRAESLPRFFIPCMLLIRTWAAGRLEAYPSPPVYPPRPAPALTAPRRGPRVSERAVHALPRGLQEAREQEQPHAAAPVPGSRGGPRRAPELHAPDGWLHRNSPASSAFPDRPHPSAARPHLSTALRQRRREGRLTLGPPAEFHAVCVGVQRPYRGPGPPHDRPGAGAQVG